jgi:hypothetical protein
MRNTRVECHIGWCLAFGNEVIRSVFRGDPSLEGVTKRARKRALTG